MSDMLPPTRPVTVRLSDIGFWDLLMLVLVHHKLAGTFDYPWALVFAPLWVPLAAHGIVLGVAYLFAKWGSRQ